MKSEAIFLMLFSIVGIIIVQKKETKITCLKPQQNLLLLRGSLNKLRLNLRKSELLMEKLKVIKESITELSEADMFYLQRLMEQKSQLEEMISNIMKATTQIQSALASNLKA